MVRPVSGTNIPQVSDASKILPGTVLGDLYDSIEDIKKQGNNVLKITVNRPLAHCRDQVSSMSEEQAKILLEAVDSSKWSLASFVFSTLYASASIMGGYWLKSHGEAKAGDEYIRAGALQLVNALATYTDKWREISRFFSFGNQTVEQILATVLPMAVTLYAHGRNSAAWNQLSKDKQDKIETISTLFTYMEATTTVTQVYMKFKQARADIKIRYLDSQMASKNFEINQLLLRRGWVQDRFDSIGSGLRRVMKNVFNTTADFAKNN